ncbi:bifunctional 2-polyprenyl-6-hydroxyphenol methylase/3-demethylubiquinol 3-O-methyltransferase UbiG [Aliikangiella maris]|uniref:Bifunctional 2-polyprenyl-6-hydroxyphenol methylase/3-demethylubiquinol 3-O-methyltransferase UbiG n=2 Tax=Aliikangiella maris TaxID=3162458 RepID=A0ABV3MJ69_9GAMM
MQLNVDNAEIKKFSDLASRWWDKESEFKPLHDINPLRLGYIAQQCGGLRGKKIIDIGCGGGILSDSMAANGAQVVGIDMGEAPLSVAKLHQLESGQNVDYQQSTAEQMAEQFAGEFDVVTCMEMIEHVPDPASVVAACAKLVKPDGHVFFSTINRTAKAFAFAIVGAEYILKMLPKGTHQFEKFVKPSELDSWSRNVALQAKELIGMHYNPITRVYKLAPGVDVNYIAHYQP